MSQKEGQGRCLPPLLPHSDEPWPSEGVLAHRLNATKGTEPTIQVFEAHRRNFLAPDDLEKIARQVSVGLWRRCHESKGLATLHGLP